MLLSHPHRFLQPEVLRLYFLRWTPGLHGLSHSPVVPPGLSACKCGTTCSASHQLAMRPLHPWCPSLPLLPIWMNVSSLTLWLSGFHTVRFSAVLGVFCFLIGCYSSFGCVRRQNISTYGTPLWPKALKKFFLSFPEDIFSLFSEREREREKHPCEREISIGCLTHTPRPKVGLQPRQMP